MRSTTHQISAGPLQTIDLVALGAATGSLWRSGDVELVGLGQIETLDIDLETNTGSIQASLAALIGEDDLQLPGTGPVGFTALPFDRSITGQLFVPAIVIGRFEDVRFVTTMNGETLEYVEALVEQVLDRPDPASPTEIELHLDRSAESWRDDVVGRARAHIGNTSLRKAVFARSLTLRANDDFPIAPIVRDLAERFDTALLFVIDGFIGASPELLISRRGRIVRAHPLAGTAARDRDPERDVAQVEGLLSSSKDRIEHRITIDWLLEELLPFCSYVDAEPEPSILTLSNVHHLGTIVEGMLSEPAAPVLNLVAAVHPTPAVGGDPQADALALIDELEGFDRGRYGGPAGWVDAAGNGEFAVSVRTAQIDGSTATIAAGVGVVAQSDPQAELEETQAKFRAMLGTFLAL
ncbi:MAG: menaquinone-specific isochorismate synthase [Verrucomicrobiales bacterium]